MVEIADPFWIRRRVVLVQCPRPVYGKTVDPWLEEIILALGKE
jgi:hypothetical protein